RRLLFRSGELLPAVLGEDVGHVVPEKLVDVVAVGVRDVLGAVVGARDRERGFGGGEALAKLLGRTRRRRRRRPLLGDRRARRLRAGGVLRRAARRGVRVVERRHVLRRIRGIALGGGGGGAAGDGGAGPGAGFA